jgi:hypothetical protein
MPPVLPHSLSKCDPGASVGVDDLKIQVEPRDKRNDQETLTHRMHKQSQIVYYGESSGSLNV